MNLSDSLRDLFNTVKKLPQMAKLEHFGMVWSFEELFPSETKLKDTRIPTCPSIFVTISDMNGGCCTESPSSYVGYAEGDFNRLHGPLQDGPLRSRYIRSTNATGVYLQIKGSCYAHAATSAYLNTAIRIYGHKPLPSFAECYRVAAYHGGEGGEPDVCIRLLEKEFHLGVLVDI